MLSASEFFWYSSRISFVKIGFIFSWPLRSRYPSSSDFQAWTAKYWKYIGIRKLGPNLWQEGQPDTAYCVVTPRCRRNESHDTVTRKSMGLFHPLDGDTNLKYKLLCFLTPNKKISKKKALAFNLDKCCHLALCLQLILFHFIQAQFFAGGKENGAPKNGQWIGNLPPLPATLNRVKMCKFGSNILARNILIFL